MSLSGMQTELSNFFAVALFSTNQIAGRLIGRRTMSMYRSEKALNDPKNNFRSDKKAG